MLAWILFIVLILGLLALDLGVFNRKAHVIHAKEALAWTMFWVALALSFNAFVYFFYEHEGWGIGRTVDYELRGKEAALEFFAAYVLEKSLSLDNIFVIAMIFAYFRVPAQFQHRILFWGIVGALAMRGAMIAVGATMLKQFSWTTYFFGALLFFTAVKMLIQRHDNFDPERNLLLRVARRFFPVSDDMSHGQFFVRLENRIHLTPLFLVLLMVETTDLLFAVDSIPAVFAVTSDPFIVFTSNVFAILGLRSLYFALAGLMDKFRYLKMSLVFVLAYVSVKMMLVHHYPIPIPVTLAVIAGILGVGIAASWVGAQRDTAPLALPIADQPRSLASLNIRQARRVVALGFGATLILLGTAMLILPGPGLLTIGGGVFALATEAAWARNLYKSVRENKSSDGQETPREGK